MEITNKMFDDAIVELKNRIQKMSPDQKIKFIDAFGEHCAGQENFKNEILKGNCPDEWSSQRYSFWSILNKKLEKFSSNTNWDWPARPIEFATLDVAFTAESRYFQHNQNRLFIVGLEALNDIMKMSDVAYNETDPEYQPF